MFKNLLKLSIISFMFLAGSVQAQTFVPNTTFGGIGSLADQFTAPQGITVASNGNIFVADLSNHRISVWTQSGNTFGNLATFGSFGFDPNQFRYPFGITISNDKIFVTDQQNNRISVWTQSGNTFGNFATFRSLFSNDVNGFNGPRDVKVSDGKIFVADADNHRISVWTTNGNTFTHLTNFGTGAIGSALNQFNRPQSVTVWEDKIFVADADNHRISVWTTSGNTFGNLTTFGGQGSALNQFNNPFGVTVSDGKIYVADQDNHRISVWTTNGNTFGNLTTFGGQGSALNQFNKPSRLTVSDSKIFVSDQENNRVSVWDIAFPTSITGISSSQTICSGIVLPLSVTASGTSLTYQWFKDNVSISEANAAMYNATVTSNSLYFVSVTGAGGSVTSAGISLSLAANTSIVTQPISQIIQPNATANLSISATGANLMYKWSSNETVSGISSKAAGIYTVTVSGTCGSVVSNAATILLISSVTISGASANGSLTSATSITISGTGFVNGATITVNGVAISNFMVVSGTSIIATFAAGTLLASNNVILVQNPNQVANVNNPVVITNVTLSTILPSYQSTSFSVYPNPVVNGEWRIENGELGATMFVFNAQGAIVYTQTITSTSTEVSAKFSSGIYLVKVGSQMVKLVVE
ncbi:MAG: T9SS C-terminal target domain-containing protein [Bacteroidetes bacterium]|nr:MAG: T9SS C-terminal target domain-containing protein [Bacteroidota bacterium]